MLIAGSTNSQYTDFHLDCLLFISFFIVFRKRKRGKINKKRQNTLSGINSAGENLQNAYYLSELSGEMICLLVRKEC
jgi:hypothetical protein